MQLEGLFDVPAQIKLTHHWQGKIDLDAKPWQVGLILGPSGCGKSTILERVFGKPRQLEWAAKSVVDDFDRRLKMEDIAAACTSVGFNSIPSWMKPHAVLSNGEKFRVDLARRLVEADGLVAIDEFTSVVDRQVAQIGAHAVQKLVRKRGLQFVAASCHYDIVEWLQPDWVFEPATMVMTWRELQRRPAIHCEIARVGYEAWQLFAPYHYLTAHLHRGAACFVLFVDSQPATFCGVLHRLHPKVHDIWGISRIVTLPDFQGLGLAMLLADELGSAYVTLGRRFRNYPAHPSFVRAHDRSSRWRLMKQPGVFSAVNSKTSSVEGRLGGRPCAVFEYAGGARMSREDARRLIDGA
jgi:ABC-type lipoprotein export system ATPase subunit